MLSLYCGEQTPGQSAARCVLCRPLLGSQSVWQCWCRPVHTVSDSTLTDLSAPLPAPVSSRRRPPNVLQSPATTTRPVPARRRRQLRPTSHYYITDICGRRTRSAPLPLPQVSAVWCRVPPREHPLASRACRACSMRQWRRPSRQPVRDEGSTATALDVVRKWVRWLAVELTVVGVQQAPVSECRAATSSRPRSRRRRAARTALTAQRSTSSARSRSDGDRHWHDLSLQLSRTTHRRLRSRRQPASRQLSRLHRGQVQSTARASASSSTTMSYLPTCQRYRRNLQHRQGTPLQLRGSSSYSRSTTGLLFASRAEAKHSYWARWHNDKRSWLRSGVTCLVTHVILDHDVSTSRSMWQVSPTSRAENAILLCVRTEMRNSTCVGLYWRWMMMHELPEFCWFYCQKAIIMNVDA